MSSPDLLSDRDTSEATYQVVRGLALGLVLVYAAFTLFHTLAESGATNRVVIAIDQIPLVVALLAFVLMSKRKLPIPWAHRVAVILGLLVAANTAASVLVQGEGNDLRYMQAVVLGAGAIALSTRAVVVLILGTAAMGVPAALVVSTRSQFMEFMVMQTATSLFSMALCFARVSSQTKLLRLRQTAAQAAIDLGHALARAEHAFAEHQRSDEQRRHLEEQLRQSQKLEALGVLAGGVAHDMNNVLGTITVLASAALRSTDQGSPLRQDLTDIADTARQGAALTRNILSFSRRGPAHRAPFQLDAVVAEVETLLVRTLPKHVTLAVECQARNGWVMGDAGQVAHLITNLCLNAADAIERQGDIQVKTRLVDLTSEQARKVGAAAGPFVELAVTDDGRGIPAEVLPRVFEPYFSTKDNSQHAGLGLAMVYGTVQQHHGGVSIQTMVGVGSTVTVVLPRLAQAPSQSAPIPPGVVRVDPARNCLLFVEDEPMLRQGGQRLAGDLGFEVLLASDGREALDVFAQHRERIGVVVLDIAMPVMNGADCCRALRGLSPALPILLTSGFPKDHDIQTLLENPHTRYIHKPYDQDDLARALAGIVGGAATGNAHHGS